MHQSGQKTCGLVLKAAAMALFTLIIGCNDKPLEVNVGRLTISPSTVPVICESEVVQLRAEVSGIANSRVRWTSLAPNVAGVDSAGSVTGRAPGAAWIKAAAVADTTLRDSVSVIVSATLSFYDNPTIWFGPTRKHGTTAAIDSSNVSGTLDVYIERDFPNCWHGVSIRLRVNDQLLCGTPVAGRGEFLCVVNTNEVTSSGVRRFPNGPTALRAELFGSSGQILASATRPPLIFNNSP